MRANRIRFEVVAKFGFVQHHAIPRDMGHNGTASDKDVANSDDILRVVVSQVEFSREATCAASIKHDFIERRRLKVATVCRTQGSAILSRALATSTLPVRLALHTAVSLTVVALP